VSTETQRQWKEEILESQNKDGGWTTAKLGDWKRSDGKPQDLDSSDGYATGFIIFVLQQTGTPAGDPNLQRGIVWLQNNQRASGRWYTRSPRIDKRHYITNAGTAFALLAINSCSDSIGDTSEILTKQSLPARATNIEK
jgi:squalene-hopene/tetraprenyl-beta-curcumene cyclase